jgi:hypothetical protein
MTACSHSLLLAEYAWINTKLYPAARSLPGQEPASERQAFFGSVFKKQGGFCLHENNKQQARPGRLDPDFSINIR